MRLPHLRSQSIAVIATLFFAIFTTSGAFAISTGNGGSQPIGQYNASPPTLTTGQTVNPQTDNHGKLIFSPSSFPSVQPISAATSLPVTGQFYQTIQPVSFPTTQPVNCVAGCSGGSSGGTSAQYNPTPPTYTTATAAPLNVDAHGNLQTVAATPLPFLPSTINIPSALPFYAASPLPVVLPSSAPNLSGATTNNGVNTNDQLFGFDGNTSSRWWPIETEQYGVLVVTPGGTTTSYYAGGGTGGSPVKQFPGRLVSLQNYSTTAQTNAMVCYDNASTASGNVLFNGKLQAFPTFGWQVIINTWAANGIFCQPTAATNATGQIVIQYE